METAGAKTRNEILSQPDVWDATLDVVEESGAELKSGWDQGGYDTVILTGCGSTYYLSLTAASVLQQLTGTPCRGVPASELLLYPEGAYPTTGRTLLIAVSRSGETTETINAARAFVDAGRGTLMTFSCYPDQPLASMGAINIVLPGAQEESVVQTRAFTSLLVAIVASAAKWMNREQVLQQLRVLPAAGRRLLDSGIEHVTQLQEKSEFESCYFLGSGPQYGLACEASLKMKEMALTPSEPFHFLELRHGPKSIVSPSMLVVGFYSTAHQTVERDVIHEVESLGGQTLTLGERNADIAFASELGEVVSTVLYLPPIQWLAAERAVRRGIDPDHPKNLDTVVKLQMS